jgi:hypothetical protein
MPPARPTYRDTYGYLPVVCVRLLESGNDGEELMARVVARLGGVTVRVPVKLSAAHRLVEALGPIDAERVWRVWRGEGAAGEIRIDVPRMTAAQTRARDRRLLSLVTGGVTVSEAARRFGLTERGAYLALSRAREAGLGEPPRQLDLFP